MADIFESPEKQKQLCVILSKLCLYATFGMMGYLIVAVWFEDLIPNKISGKLWVTYFILLIGSYIIRHIFIESYKKVETVSTKTVTTRREDPPS